MYYNKYHHFYTSDIVSSCLKNRLIYSCCRTSGEEEVRSEKSKSVAQMVALAGFQVIVSMLYHYKTLALYVLLILFSTPLVVVHARREEMTGCEHDAPWKKMTLANMMHRGRR